MAKSLFLNFLDKSDTNLELNNSNFFFIRPPSGRISDFINQSIEFKDNSVGQLKEKEDCDLDQFNIPFEFPPIMFEPFQDKPINMSESLSFPKPNISASIQMISRLCQCSIRSSENKIEQENLLKNSHQTQKKENKNVMQVDKEFKNVTQNILKCVIRHFISGQYSKKVKRLAAKLNVKYQEVRCYFKKLVNMPLGLGDNYNLINFQEENAEQKGFKRSFYGFYQWFLRNKYAVSLLTKGKAKSSNQILYLQGKNRLLYFPKLTNHAHFKLQQARPSDQNKCYVPFNQVEMRNSDHSY